MKLLSEKKIRKLIQETWLDVLQEKKKTIVPNSIDVGTSDHGRIVAALEGLKKEWENRSEDQFMSKDWNRNFSQRWIDAQKRTKAIKDDGALYKKSRRWWRMNWLRHRNALKAGVAVYRGGENKGYDIRYKNDESASAAWMSLKSKWPEASKSSYFTAIAYRKELIRFRKDVKRSADAGTPWAQGVYEEVVKFMRREVNPRIKVLRKKRKDDVAAIKAMKFKSKKSKKRTGRRKRIRICGQSGSDYGQQDFKPKDPKLKKGPDPEYDKFYADLDAYKLTRYLGRRGKDYWWGPAHVRAYKRLVCAAEDAGKSLAPTEAPVDDRGAPAKEPAAPPQPTINIPDWAKKLGSENIASPAGPDCPPQWSPSRPARAVFLEKNEKEQWALYAKYPNQRPDWFPKWLESTKAKMEKREKTLRDFALRYLQVKTKNKLTLSDIKLTAMIRSTGTLQPDGMVKMKEVLVKMLDCEIKWFNMPEDEKKKALAAAKPAKPEPAPEPAPKPKPGPEPKPIPDDDPKKNPIYAPPLDPPEEEEKGSVTFEEAIMATQYGDKMSVTFLRDVTVKRGILSATPFKAGKTYSGAVYGKIKINHEEIDFVGSQSEMTKKKFIARVKQQGEPCKTVDCNKSTITRGAKRVTFNDFLKNPNVLA